MCCWLGLPGLFRLRQCRRSRSDAGFRSLPVIRPLSLSLSGVSLSPREKAFTSALTRRGFQLTLLFVAVTIVAAVVADFRFGAELVAIDPLHGGAEAFLTLSNAVIVAGLVKPQKMP